MKNAKLKQMYQKIEVFFWRTLQQCRLSGRRATTLLKNGSFFIQELNHCKKTYYAWNFLKSQSKNFLTRDCSIIIIMPESDKLTFSLRNLQKNQQPMKFRIIHIRLKEIPARKEKDKERNCPCQNEFCTRVARSGNSANYGLSLIIESNELSLNISNIPWLEKLSIAQNLD